MQMRCQTLARHVNVDTDIITDIYVMVIYLSGEIEDQLSLDELTPRQIVAELDKHVVGQNAAKRAVAIALRNRIRRQKLPPTWRRT